MPPRYKATKWVDENYHQMNQLWKIKVHGKTTSLTMNVWSDQMSISFYAGVGNAFLDNRSFGAKLAAYRKLSMRNIRKLLL